MLFFSIYDEKMTKLSRKKTVSEQWRHQALVNAWQSWIDARRQYILIVLLLQLVLLFFLLRQVSLSVCLLTGLLKSYWSNLCEILRSGWKYFRDQLTRFCCWESGSGIFWRKFTVALLATVKVGSATGSLNTQDGGPQTEEIKALSECYQLLSEFIVSLKKILLTSLMLSFSTISRVVGYVDVKETECFVCTLCLV